MGVADGDLVGRAAELAQLGRLLDDVERTSSVVLVTGEAGIGKTALLDALASEAGERGFSVAVGRCAPNASPPFWPWPRVLRALGGGAEEVAAATVGGRAGLFAAAADRLEASSESRPVVVIIDDLQWADESSLALAMFLAAAVGGLRAALAFGVRDEPAELTPTLRDAVAALPADVTRLQLTGLDLPATSELLGNVLGCEPPAGLAEQLHVRTAGNPLFVKECARLFAARGASTTVVVPDGVRHVITRRVARLSPRAYTVLAAASVTDDFDSDFLSELTEMPASDVTAGLGEGHEERIVVIDDDGYRFAHALIRQTLLDTQPAGPRAELHRRAAAMLESRLGAIPPDGRAALAERAAAHWVGVTPGGRANAARLAVEAARSAADQLGHDHAARLYRWAIDLGDDTVETLTDLGETEILAGQMTGGRQTLAVAAARAASERRGEALARAVLASGSGPGGYEVDVRDEQQVRLLRDALSLLSDEESGPRAAALARIALIDGSLPTERRATFAEEAAAIAARLGDTAAEVTALAAGCDVLSGPDHVDDRLTATARMVELARGQPDPVVLLVARRHRLLALLEHGDVALVDDEIAAYARTSGHLRVPLYSWIVPIWRGMRALMDGDLGEASEQSDAAETLGRSADSANADVLTFSLRFAIARASGSTAELDREVKRILGDYEGYPAADVLRATHLLLTDRSDGARRLLQRRMSAGLASIPRDSEWLEAIWNLGDVAVALGDLDAVAAVYDSLVPYAHLWAVAGIGAACYGSVSDQLGRLSLALDRRAEAQRWLEAAHHAHTAAGAGSLTASTAALLGSLAEPSSSSHRLPTDAGELMCNGTLWHLRWQGTTATVRHSKGLLDIARLLERPGRELHSLDLMEPTGSAPLTVGLDVLDNEAKRSYKRRLEELELEIDSAAETHDDVRLVRLEHERDLLISELSHVYGLSGRQRTTGDSAERARKAVGMRIATAVRAITAVHPGLGRHFERSLVTGRYCSYQPEADVVWTVSYSPGTAGHADS